MTQPAEVSWDDPENPDATFTFDPMHSPFPLSRLFQTTMGEAIGEGFMAGTQHYNMPIALYENIARNNYRYERIVPRIPKDDEEAQTMNDLAEQTAKASLPGMMQRWNDEHLPALIKIMDELRAIAALPPAEAANPVHVETAKQGLRDAWMHHFRIVLPMLLALQLYDELFAELFGDDADSHKLLIGIESESVKTGHVLTDLAIQARQLGLADVFASTPTAELPAVLRTSEPGRQFLSALESAMSSYGLRSDLLDYLDPTWLEDPSIPLAQIRQYLENGRDNRLETAAMAEQATAAIASAREALASYPEAVRGQFETFLQLARDASFLHEEHNFYIDQQATALARLAFLNVGHGLVERGLLASAEDVFMLTYDQLQAAVNDGIDSREIAAESRINFTNSWNLTPPPFVGPAPTDGPPADNPIGRGLLRFFGGPPQDSGDPDKIKGWGGSRGQVTGEAFVARTLDAASHIQPGQILVTITTLPAWTSLFGFAAAVVTETGGPLSHCAVVAREYAMPAVVGAHGATQRITTGQTITVDGTTGIVTLHA